MGLFPISGQIQVTTIRVDDSSGDVWITVTLSPDTTCLDRGLADAQQRIEEYERAIKAAEQEAAKDEPRESREPTYDLEFINIFAAYTLFPSRLKATRFRFRGRGSFR